MRDQGGQHFGSQVGKGEECDRTLQVSFEEGVIVVGEGSGTEYRGEEPCSEQGEGRVGGDEGGF